jgi:hypothetical protein
MPQGRVRKWSEWHMCAAGHPGRRGGVAGQLLAGGGFVGVIGGLVSNCGFRAEGAVLRGVPGRGRGVYHWTWLFGEVRVVEGELMG